MLINYLLFCIDLFFIFSRVFFFKNIKFWTGKYLFSEQGCSNYLTMLKIPHIISYTISYFYIHTLLFFFIKIEMDFPELWCIIVYVWLRQVTVDSRKWEPHITRYRDTFFFDRINQSFSSRFGIQTFHIKVRNRERTKNYASELFPLFSSWEETW